MLETSYAHGVANWKASSTSVNMNEALDLSPSQAHSITQEDLHIDLEEHDGELSELRTGLDTIDNTQHYEEVLLFNSFRREDPSISLAEQVHRFKKAVSQLPSRILDPSADTEQGDFTDLPRSLVTKEHVDEDRFQELQDVIGEAGLETCREVTSEDQHQQERPKSRTHSNFTGTNAVTKAKTHNEGVRRCENPSVRIDRPSDLSVQATDIKIADRSPSMPVQASTQGQVKDNDRSLKRGQEEVTRTVKSPAVPLPGVRGQEDGVVHGSIGRSTTRVGELK